MKKARGPSEAQIQSACDDLMVLDGWRIIKTDLPHLRGLGVQEKGMPDRLYIRYEGFLVNLNMAYMRDMFPTVTDLRCLTQCLWIEWKKRGGKAAQHQLDWHAMESARGAVVVVAGRDFPASVDGYLGWYNKSGLARRRLTLARKP